MANKLSNFGVEMPTLPPPEDYLADAMMPERKADFEKWYAANYKAGFLLDEKLAEYCCSDVGTFLPLSLVDPRKIQKYLHMR